MIISIEIFRKYIWQNPTPFQDLKKKLNKLGLEGNFLNLIRASTKTPQPISHLMVREWRLSLYDKNEGENVCSCHFYSTLYWRVWQAQLGKKNKCKSLDWKGRMKTMSFAGDIILYIDYPKESTQKVWEQQISDENVLVADSGDSCTTLWLLKINKFYPLKE